MNEYRTKLIVAMLSEKKAIFQGVGGGMMHTALIDTTKIHDVAKVWCKKSCSSDAQRGVSGNG